MSSAATDTAGPPLRVAVLADSDTRWKWGALTARRLVPNATPGSPGHRLDGYLLRGRATPTERQLAEVGVQADSLREVTMAGFVRTMNRELCDVLVLSCVGGAVQSVLHGLARAWRDAAGQSPAEGRDAGGTDRGRDARNGGYGVGSEPYPEPVRDALRDRAGREGPGGRAAGAPGAGVPGVVVRRPVVVTGYVGVVYEKLADGLLLRHGADVVLANSRYDAERFRAVYEGVGADADCVVECALPFLGGDRYADRQARRAGQARTSVVFAVQPSVPGDPAGRRYLLNRAIQHARSHPDRDVMMKLRSKPGEHTTHIEELPYQTLATKIPDLPPNFRLGYGSMGEVLDGTDLLVTVSSTAALESLHRGIPTAVLTDLGVRESLGNHHFVGSGCLASWDQLDDGYLPVPDPNWLARHGVCADGSYPTAFDLARKRVAELVAADRLPLPAPYYTATVAPGYLPTTLARYGLEPDGLPRPEGAAGGRNTNTLRRAARRAARGAYRHGVQRVAPVLRRMGQL